MRLGETLLPWKSKGKKCCLYETPYVAAPVRVLGDVIAKFSTLLVTNFGCTYNNQKFFLVHKRQVSEETVSSYWDSYMRFLRGGLQAKVVPERTTYRVT
jgi:hypothetical protein